MLGLFGLAAVTVSQTAENVKSHRTAARAESKAASLRRQTRLLEANLAKVLLISEALWEMLRDNLGLTDEQLREKIYEVDMRDGTLDGKHQRKAVECPSCSHMVSSRHPACLYCGQIIDDSIFTVS